MALLMPTFLSMRQGAWLTLALVLGAMCTAASGRPIRRHATASPSIALYPTLGVVCGHRNRGQRRSRNRRAIEVQNIFPGSSLDFYFNYRGSRAKSAPGPAWI